MADRIDAEVVDPAGVFELPAAHGPFDDLLRPVLRRHIKPFSLTRNQKNPKKREKRTISLFLGSDRGR